MPDFVRSARLSWGLLCLTMVVCAVAMAGCASWRGTEPVFQNQLVAYYDRLARDVATLDSSIQSQVPPPSLGEGRSLTAPNPEDRWPISLAEAIRLGISNNTIIRQNAQFMSPNNPVLQNPDAVPSIYDSDIQNAGVLFGSRGINAALSDFDPRLTSTMKWSRDENAQNSNILSPPLNVLTNEGAQSQTRLEQQLLSGGVFSIANNWNYAQTNQPAQLFASTYTGTLGAEFRQPLWSGSGRTFTSIAGPSTQRARGFSNVSQGIVIAHINKRLSEIDFQENLQNFVREIGDLYWDLFQNYQDYDYARDTSKVAKELWDRLLSRTGIDYGVEVSQAEDAYYESKASEEQALSTLFMTEAKLRRLLGLSLDDTRLLYPSDEPREDEFTLNRATCLFEALVNRIELTRQKTNVHSLELQLMAARKLVAPKLDFVAGYALNAFGDKLYNGNTSDVRHTAEGFNSALGSLARSKETSWDLGFEYSIPLWLRQEKAQVAQLELRIIKARAALAAQEDEIAHELNAVLMTIKRSHSMSKITHRRLQAARKRVIAAESEYTAKLKGSDQFLRALTSQTQAQVAYARSITEYNKALRDLLYRMGHLLSADGISLLGIDGLPLLPPPSPDGPFEELPMPSGPDKKVPTDPDDLPGDEVDPKPNRKPRVADADDRFTSVPRAYDDDRRLPENVTDDVPVELSEELPVHGESDFPEARFVEWDDFDKDITPASGSR